MDRLTIKNIKLHGHYGVSKEERTVGGLYEIDAEIFLDNRKAAEDDDIGSMVDYSELYDCVAESFQGSSRKLIESAAENIAGAVLRRFKQVQEVSITLRKRPPMNASLDYVEIQVVRSR